jgi:hypothetical protein
MPTPWDTIKTWFTDNAKQYSYVTLLDPNASVQKLVPYQHYLRVWLADMFLGKSRDWFVDEYPAVNAQIRLAFAGQTVTFSQMASPPKELLGPGVFRNYPLTPLLPYPGGIVEVLAGLLALQGKSGWAQAVKVLEKFSSLVAPPLGQTLALAREVTSAVGDFVGQANGAVHLGLHQSFVSVGGGGANVLGTGYRAILLAPQNKFTDQNLTVVDDSLHSGGKALTGIDYMLFRIEARLERDDWQLPSIVEPWDKARTAFATGKPDEGKEHKTTAIAAAFMSPDLTRPDQLRVAKAIKADLTEVEGLGLGAVDMPAPDLEACVKAQGPSMSHALKMPRPSLSELLAD